MNFLDRRTKRLLFGSAVALLSLLLWHGLRSSPAAPQVFEWQIEGNPEENFNEAQFRLWIPTGIRPQGILVILQGSGMCGLHLADDPGWRDLAMELRYALLAYHMTESKNGRLFHHPEEGSGQALLDGLAYLAGQSRQPGLERLPLALAGFSVGGQFAYHFSQWKPGHAAAFVTMKGGYHRMPLDGIPLRPGLLIAGENDADFRVRNLSELFDAGKKCGAPWQFVMEPGEAHACENASKLVAPFFRSVLMRNQLEDLKTFEDHASCFIRNPASYPLPSLNFQSHMPEPLASARPDQVDFESISWDQGSQWRELTLQVPENSSRFDRFEVRFLRGSGEIAPLDSRRISIRIPPKKEQILGSFNDHLIFTFYKKRNKQIDCLRVPIYFKRKGDIELSPSFIWGNKAALAKGQAISLRVAFHQEGKLEYLGSRSKSKLLNERWEQEDQGRYRLSFTLQNTTPDAKELLPLAFKTSAGTVVYLMQVISR